MSDSFKRVEQWGEVLATLEEEESAEIPACFKELERLAGLIEPRDILVFIKSKKRDNLIMSVPIPRKHQEQFCQHLSRCFGSAMSFKFRVFRSPFPAPLSALAATILLAFSTGVVMSLFAFVVIGFAGRSYLFCFEDGIGITEKKYEAIKLPNLRILIEELEQFGFKPRLEITCNCSVNLYAQYPKLR